MNLNGELTTPAVLLRTRALGEADLIVVLLSPILGKIHAAARNARRSRRRFPSGLTGGACGEAVVARGRGSLLRLHGFVGTLDGSLAGSSLETFASVAYVCELIDQLVLEQEPDPRLFEHLSQTIGAVLTSGTNWPLILRRFELGLLDCLGLLPTLDCCCVCGDPLDLSLESVAFDEGRGGCLCQNHAGSSAVMTTEAVVLARELVGLPWATGSDEPPARPSHLAVDATPPAVRRALRDLSFHPLRRHLTRPLRSLAFFSQLSAASARAQGHGDVGRSEESTPE